MIYYIIFIICFAAFFALMAAMNMAVTKRSEIKYIKTFWILSIIFDIILSTIVALVIVGLFFIMKMGLKVLLYGWF